MKRIVRLIILLITNSIVFTFLFWFTINNVGLLIVYAGHLYDLYIRNEYTDLVITPPWLPFLSVPGMFIMFWLFRTINQIYEREKENNNQEQ